MTGKFCREEAQGRERQRGAGLHPHTQAQPFPAAGALKWKLLSIYSASTLPGPQSGSVRGSRKGAGTLCYRRVYVGGNRDVVRLKNAVGRRLSSLILSGQHKTCNSEEEQRGHD